MRVSPTHAGRRAGFACHVLVIFSLILIAGRVSSEVTDKDVLLDLKHYLEANNKIYQGEYARWNISEPSHCQWHGIACDKAGRVTGVDLSASVISGAIFPNFSRLTELTNLDLSSNTISSTLPADLNKCTKLQYLNLSRNLIEGELNLTGLVNLESLDVTVNRFNGSIRAYFPAVCSNLDTLVLSTNKFTGEITGLFDECPKLTYLDLSTNQFSGEMWQGFSFLVKFTVTENNLTGQILPSSFPPGCNLTVLDISSNNLHGVFPSSIANCSNLNSLNLWGNGFTGAIPSAIGALSELQVLLLGKNAFYRNIPKELLNCSKLEFLDISKNNFGGDIQKIFGRFTMVKYLILHGNQYTGGIESSGIPKHPNLTRLDLSCNNFSGNLPIELATMPNLKFLFLAYNQFSGSIPPEFGKAPKLQALDLSYNELTGPIPSTIGNLTSLLWLMLANNQLSGVIPPEIGNCNSLLWLNLANNQLSDRIPPEISTIGSDPYPTFEANRREILDGNVGTGDCLAIFRWIPTSCPPFSFVYNQMTRKTCRTTWDRLIKGYGMFPICLNSSSPVRTLTISGYLQLSGNQLSAELPPEIGSIRNISLIHVDANQLSGRFPMEIAKLPLVVLNASENLFSGEIPSELGEVQCLQTLDLSRNNFSGELPRTLTGLAELNMFNISYNPFLSGVIPSTGQMSTFDNDSFLGDPLIIFASSGGTSPPVQGTITVDSTRGRRWRTTAPFWGFLCLSAAFFTVGFLSIVYCLRRRNPVDPEPDLIHFDDIKRKKDAAESPPSALDPSSAWPSDGVKVFRLVKIPFTYADIVAATTNFSDEMMIGSGGYGVVYRGVLPDGRHVAVKKLRREGKRWGEEGEKEFRAEMEVLAGRTGFGSAVHPNLVALYGWCLSGSASLLVYEYMDGGSLEEVVTDWVRFGWERRLETAVGVARALAFLHHECRPAVVHRDVKASNVLLDRRGRAKVTDFGLARVVRPGESHVSTMLAGTVGYVAPEYGQTWQATTRGDVYSYGVLAMELATGRRAVDGGEESLVDRMRRLATEVAGAMAVGAEEGGGVAEMRGLLRVALRCTAEAPQARPDMKEVLEMLSKIVESGGRERCDMVKTF